MDLVGSLSAERIRTRKALVTKWKQNPNFLLREVIAWVGEDGHDRLKAAWPYVE
jgi:hypothetical protein